MCLIGVNSGNSTTPCFNPAGLSRPTNLLHLDNTALLCQHPCLQTVRGVAGCESAICAWNTTLVRSRLLRSSSTYKYLASRSINLFTSTTNHILFFLHHHQALSSLSPPFDRIVRLLHSKSSTCRSPFWASRS